jgi:hypothetical protein
MSAGTGGTPADHAHWWRTVRLTAPLAPSWVSTIVVRAMLTPSLTSDGLLFFADALDEAAGIAFVTGDTELSAQLRKLADLPRAAAPERAQREGQ